MMEEKIIKLFKLLNYKSFVCKTKCQSEQPCTMYCNQFEQEVLATTIKQLQLKDNQIKLLEEGFDNSTKLNDKLREEIKVKDLQISTSHQLDIKLSDEIKLKDKMIERAKEMFKKNVKDCNGTWSQYEATLLANTITKSSQQALAELESEE